MRRTAIIKFIMLAILAGSMSACKKGKELKTESGFKYRLYTETKGAKAQLGDYVIIDMVYKTEDDSVLFDSRAKTPLRFKLENIPFSGSYEDGLTNLAEGDSATFYVPADSLYNYYYPDIAERIEQEKTVFKPKSFLLFDVKLIDIQDYVEAEQDQLIRLSKSEKLERENLKSFLTQRSFVTSADSGLYFYNLLKKGTGTQISNGKFVSLKYTGKFLDGKVFDNFGTPEKPFVFRVGERKVLKGWEDAITNFRQGDKFELIIPSVNAYAEEGLLDVKSGQYIIPPFTTLWYEMEILNVTDTLRIAKK
ncbi:MAG: hypothetical protein EYC69_14005 [Bacteroidetes bacterium]|nr:MAG: hypothetical protein EYC69_14005 [Bacteroidota bacterium]